MVVRCLLLLDNMNTKSPTMNKDNGRDYSFIVTNTGKGNTGKISLSLPKFMTALTGATMTGLNQNDTTTVVLRMIPTDDMQLNVPVTGMLGINCENGNGTFINFTITPVSDVKGTLVIGTSVNPGDKFKVSWVVKNIGQVSTDDGWSEQISNDTAQ